MKHSKIVLALGLLLASPAAWAQGRGNDKDKDKKEYKGEKDKKDEYKYKEKDDKDRYKDNERYKGRGGEDDRYEGRGTGTGRVGGTVGGILGRVIFPPAGTVGPRRLEGVPKGHYPPPGECRIWYPNRPPGHQPPPRSCESLVGVRLEPGAFILHGDQAYDAGYDWRQEERRRPGSVGRDILDILFPNRR